MCTYQFFKKKKKVEWNCGNGIAEFHSTFHNSKSFFLPPISAMPLSQLPKIYTPILAMPLPQTIFFFPPILGNGIATIAKKKKFPIIWFSLCALTFRAPTRAVGMGRRNCGNTIAENQKFLSPTFYLSLSNFCWISAMVLPQFTLFPQIAK